MVVDASRDGVLVPVLRRRSFLHLGTEVARTGGVPADRAASAVRTVRRLSAACEEAGVDVVVALATAALRDADNGSRLISRLEQVLGSKITLLTGEEEARLCFLGPAGRCLGGTRAGARARPGRREPGSGHRHHRRGHRRGQRGPRHGPPPRRARDRRAADPRRPQGHHRGGPPPGRADPGHARADTPAPVPGSSPAGARCGPWPDWPWASTGRCSPRARCPRSRSTRWRSRPVSSSTSPTAWPRSTWTPVSPCPGSRPDGRPCCPSGRWCSPRWSRASACSAWW